MEDRIRLFAISERMVESDLDRIEKEYDIHLRTKDDQDNEFDDTYYPQFEMSIRNEAQQMAYHYQLFYCLEKSIRTIIMEKLSDKYGSDWWDIGVPLKVKEDVGINMQREKDSGVTTRSIREIDYTTFGQLGDIVREEWDVFSDTFNNQKAFNKIMTSLNLLRGPIAHCTLLAPDEVLRLKLALKDWFRLME